MLWLQSYRPRARRPHGPRGLQRPLRKSTNLHGKHKQIACFTYPATCVEDAGVEYRKQGGPIKHDVANHREAAKVSAAAAGGGRGSGSGSGRTSTSSSRSSTSSRRLRRRSASSGSATYSQLLQQQQREAVPT